MQMVPKITVQGEPEGRPQLGVLVVLVVVVVAVVVVVLNFDHMNITRKFSID